MCLSNNSDTVMSKNTNVKVAVRSNLPPKQSVQILNERRNNKGEEWKTCGR